MDQAGHGLRPPERVARHVSLIRGVFVALGVAYVAARIVAFLGVDAREFRDTIDYNEVADAPLNSRTFLSGDHPPTIPFAYKLLGDGDGGRLAGQLAFSILCWLALAATAASVLRDSWMRVLAFAAVLGFSLSIEVLLWDALLLSESISISLTAALVAAWLLFASRPSYWTVALALVVTGAWTLARDPHAYVLLMAAAVLAASLAVRNGRVLRAVALVGVLAIAATSIQSASVGYKRWEYPLQNIVAVRIAADPDDLDWFRDAGMPVTDEFLDRAEKYRAGADDPFAHPAGIENPDLRDTFLPFQFWIVDEGRGAYLEFLATHPGYVADAFGDLDHTLLDPEVERYQSEDPPWSFGALPYPFYPPGPVLPLVFLTAALALAVIAARRARPPPTWAVPLFLVASSLPFAVLVWHGEVLEIDRHGLIASQFLRLGALLLLIMALDDLIAGRRSPARPAAPE